MATIVLPKGTRRTTKESKVLPLRVIVETLRTEFNKTVCIPCGGSGQEWIYVGGDDDEPTPCPKCGGRGLLNSWGFHETKKLLAEYAVARKTVRERRR